MNDRPSPSSSREGAADSIRVLLVDDDERWGEVTAKHLSATNDDLDVTFRASATAGRDVLDSAAVDCIVSDYQMPDQSGLEFLTQVRERYPDLPFLLLTGRGNEEVASAAIEKGVTGYISKDATRGETPVLPSRIRSVVETYRTKRRLANAQRRIERLHDVTLDLEQLQTRTDVYERMAAGAASTLDLGTCRVLIVDGESFRQVAISSPCPDGDAEAVDVEALAHDCLDTGRAAIHEPVGPDGTVSSALCVPVGSTGVLLATDQASGSYDRHDLNACDILASHASAALDRVRSQEQIQRERDGKEAMRDLLTSTATRDDVERAVCEHLVGEDGYELAWVGEPSGTDTVSVRTAAGDDDYLSAVSLSAPDGDTVEPAVQAVRQQTPVTVTLDGDASAAWARDAVERGIRQVVARPLDHGEVGHGVLVVYASDPLDQARRQLLDEFADSLATAVTEAKRKQALGADVVTELELQVSDRTSLFVALWHKLAARGEATRIDVRAAIPGDDEIRYYVALPDADPETVASIGAPSGSVLNVDLDPVSESSPLFEVVAARPTVESLLIDHGGVLVDDVVADGRATISVEFDRRTDVSTIAEEIRTQYPQTTVVSVRDRDRQEDEQATDPTASLTDKQLRALRTAYFSGYYERPRARNATEVADSLGLSRQAFLQHLRVAERKALGSLLDN